MPRQLLQIEKIVLHDLHVAQELLRAAKNKKEVLRIAIRIFEKMGFQRIRIWLMDHEKNEMYGGACNHIPDARFGKERHGMDQHHASRAFREAIKNRRPYFNPTPRVIQRLGFPEIAETIEFPMVSGKTYLGIIGVDSDPHKRKLSLHDGEHVIMPFVNHVALILHRVLTEQEIKKANRELKEKIQTATTKLKEKNAELNYLALHDELTGLPNRRHFNKTIEEEFARASDAHPLALAMMDLDFLKHVNDTRGHLVGDDVIAKIGKILRESRAIRYAARYAGDEFVMLLRNCRHPADLRIVERLRKKILADVKQSVSIGIASYPASGVESIIDLVRKADDALYHAKHTGRGKTVCCADTRVNILSAEERRRLIQRLEAGGTVVADYIGQLEVLNDISKKLQNIRTEREICRTVLKAFRSELGFLRVRMYHIDAAADTMRCTYATGMRTHELPALNRRISDKTSLTSQAVKKQVVIDSEDPKYHSFLNPLLAKRFGTQATIVVPLVANQEPIGALVGDYRPEKEHFDQTSHRLFLSIGNHIALALQQVRLIEQVQNFNKHLEQRIGDATSKLRDYSSSLEEKIQDNQSLRESERQAHFDIISALVVSLESKDVYTRGHSARVAKYASRLGRAAGLRNSHLAMLRYGALLHDIGKLTIDQHLLNKKHELTRDEIQKLTEHPVIGGKIVSSIRFLKDGALFVRHHHERWDGLGYPDGLKGEAIPLEARIINIADSYDAMITRRSYGKKMTKKEAIAEFVAGSKKQFDPKLAALFIQLIEKRHI